MHSARKNLKLIVLNSDVFLVIYQTAFYQEFQPNKRCKFLLTLLIFENYDTTDSRFRSGNE